MKNLVFMVGEIQKNMKRKEKLAMRKKIFIITDECMWEANKQNGTRAPHTIAVVDEKTGQFRWIKSGSRIQFLAGEITSAHTQEEYNEIKREP